MPKPNSAAGPSSCGSAGHVSFAPKREHAAEDRGALAAGDHPFVQKGSLHLLFCIYTQMMRIQTETPDSRGEPPPARLRAKALVLWT